MKKTILEGLLRVFRVERTEQFFQEFQETREALKRLSNSDIHPLDGTKRDQVEYSNFRDFARDYLPEFNSNKSDIKLLTSEGRWCYVPGNLRDLMNNIVQKEKFYSQFYWDIKNNRAVHV